jgi:hypothetical protein
MLTTEMIRILLSRTPPNSSVYGLKKLYTIVVMAEIVPPIIIVNATWVIILLRKRSVQEKWELRNRITARLRIETIRPATELIMVPIITPINAKCNFSTTWYPE